MFTTSTFNRRSPWPNQQARMHPSTRTLKFWKPRYHLDMRRTQSVSSSEDGADSAGLELSFLAKPSPCLSLKGMDSQDRYPPRRPITQSVSNLAAPSRDEIDTPDKDDMSVSGCSHVARSLSEVVEREVTTVASSPNPVSASTVAIGWEYPRHSIPSRVGFPFRQTSSIDPDAATNIPHIIVSEDTSPTREATGQVSESSELMVSLQSRTHAGTYNWARDEREFLEYLPCRINHYARKSYIDEWDPAKFTVPAMLTEFNTVRRILPQTEEEEVLPEGWTKHTHSDGKSYFYHDKDKVITEEWLYDRDIAEKVSRYIAILNDAISKRAVSFGRIKSWHLYVEIAEYGIPSWEGDNRCRCKYYFVNLDEECIFWLSKFQLDDYLWELRGDMSPDFIRRFLQREYWNHQYFFSDIHPLTKAQWRTVQKYVLLAESDVNMSDTSTVT
ncbi:uncharacterized protein EV420DRAFT_1103971 [Desarmillaria tabescens]|uniref:WW domain-containing protein n=1 Tax=Armillaria tabescens TaxID=1929756 RepID=A0AA39NDL4_ARMTA|nr:uncharacterized protein EV420DRAFT_1103971 [Desarmillaria tabescens]KAK0463705.1 hypothetical protein EV420DRAFT_1103971 [Desarmillaria tabescens]